MWVVGLIYWKDGIELLVPVYILISLCLFRVHVMLSGTPWITASGPTSVCRIVIYYHILYQ